MRRHTLLAFSASLLLAACGGAGVDDVYFGPDTPPGEQMVKGERDLARRVFDLMNQARLEAGKPALVWNETAADVAYDHAVDMRVRGFYAHVNPDGDGPCQRLMAREIAMTSCGGENIARGPLSAEEAMGQWMASSSHRATLLSGGWTHVGVGVHTGGGGPWWVVDFFVGAEAQ